MVSIDKDDRAFGDESSDSVVGFAWITAFSTIYNV